jgi:hypothetical protein
MEEARDEGRAMSFEQAVEYALEERTPVLWIPLRLRVRARNELPLALPLAVESHLHNALPGRDQWP